MAKTQDLIPIEDIKDGLIILKDGGAVVILQTSAVNFGLLSTDEQIAIIDSFAQMLNSLSFAIQIVILSKRLDISSYLHLLDRALSLQPNPLLSQLMINYRQFVQSLIKDNEVLDKSFYIAVSVSGLEMGVGVRNKEDRVKKAKTLILPRRDQVARQLARIGLKTSQLDDRALLSLFYEIYNPPEGLIKPVAIEAANLSVPQSTQTPTQSTQAPEPNPPSQQPAQTETRGSRTHPFVVEELVETL